MEVGIKVEGLDQAERKTAQLAALLTDLRPFYPILRGLFISWMGRQFDTEGDFGGAPWEPLSDQYAQWKNATYPGKKILSLEGPLRKAATSPRTTAATGRLLELTIEPYVHPATAKNRQKGPVTVSPDWFQSGTDRMPARPLLFETLPGEALGELEAAGAAYAQEIIRRVGLAE